MCKPSKSSKSPKIDGQDLTLQINFLPPPPPPVICVFASMPLKMIPLCCLFSFPTVRSGDGDDEEEVVHMGNAIMSFYSALIDLLGRCAPEMHVSFLETVTLLFLFFSWNRSVAFFSDSLPFPS